MFADAYDASEEDNATLATVLYDNLLELKKYVYEQVESHLEEPDFPLPDDTAESEAISKILSLINGVRDTDLPSYREWSAAEFASRLATGSILLDWQRAIVNSTGQ
jgi:hypothetical protein